MVATFQTAAAVLNTGEDSYARGRIQRDGRRIIEGGAILSGEKSVFKVGRKFCAEGEECCCACNVLLLLCSSY